MRFAEIVVGLPIEGPFTYRIPEIIKDTVAIGKRAWVPFRNRTIVGYIVGFTQKADVENIKPVHSIIDEEPILNQDLLATTKWMSGYYFCSWGEAIEAAIPAGLKKGKVKFKKSFAQEAEQIEPSVDLKPTVEQDKIIKAIQQDLLSKRHRTYLLHGVTGSGKTEVYLQAIGYALKSGRGSIVLVPEISLTAQTIERFKSRFSQNVAVLHSRLTDAQRFVEWKKIKDRQAKIVVGARSAIFAPLKDLGLVVIDEEHENTYKQQDVPRYHARDVAIKRAAITGAVVILGSATPSLESYYLANKGAYSLVNLTHRIENRDLPSVEIIDMRQYLQRGKKDTIFSKPLEESTRDVLKKNEQAILFLNRRGFSTFVHCRKCGFVARCRNCAVTLTYHFDNKKLVCHWCNYQESPPDICPKCKSSYISYAGTGTEKVESEMHRVFAGANISRMDTDATARRDSHKRILGEFKSGQTNLLIGTQMIAKGLDYPKVTLVGVVSADVALHIPDFRSGERTFSLLTQVAGRAGRGDAGGKVLVQTYTPGHYAITAATKHDYRQFYNREIGHRRQLILPPFVHLVLLTFRGKKQEKVIESANRMLELLKKQIKDSRGDNTATKDKIYIAGPAPAPVPRLRKEYRWNLILKAKKIEDAVGLLRQVLKKYKKTAGVKLAVDVDPL